jgi:ATP-binding cassette subfamily F protein 3
MLFLKNLTKTFGAQVLFSEANFQLNLGERIGVVGRNGSGKSTLFRLILKTDTPDEGEISFPKNYRIRGLDQHLKFDKNSILDEVCQSLSPGQEHNRWKAEKLLSGLGFSQKDFTRPPEEFSGGFQIRIKLAELLLSEPDLLLLDEPTNYLDIVTTRWLERFLQSWKHELICISHDQAFLENISTHTMAVHRQRFKKVKGSPKKCYAQINREEELHQRTRSNQAKETKKQEKFIREFRSGARSAGLVQSRIKMLNKKEKLKALPPIPPIKFGFTEVEFTGAKMIDAHNLSFGYEPGQDLLKKLTVEIFPGDKVGIIGANGKGKSTFLRALNREIELQSGTLKTHQNAHLGYMGQSNVDRLEPNKNIVEELSSVLGAGEQMARNIAGNLLFSGDLAYKPIKVLSGGEKSRVNLGKVLLTPVNCLLLDEPTNHLDYESVDAFIDAIQNFAGAVVFVSHNETFLTAIAEKLIVFDGDKVFFYQNNYETFLREKGFQSEQEEPPTAQEKAETKKTAHNDHKGKKAKEKLIRPLKRKLNQIEKRIFKLESDQKANVEEFKVADNQGNRLKMETLGIQYQDLQKELESQWEIWNQIAEEIGKVEDN